MKLKPVLIVYTPIVLALFGIAIFSPAVLSWPVTVGLAVAMGVFGGVAMQLFADDQCREVAARSRHDAVGANDCVEGAANTAPE